MKEKTLIILIGLQGSGKSTFYRTHLADYVHVNLDTQKNRTAEWELVEDCLASGKSLVIDNTNASLAERARYIQPARAAGYRIEGYFLSSKFDECMARNAKREGKACVPKVALAATKKRLVYPSLAEGFDALYYVKNDGEEMTVFPWRTE